MPRPPKSKAQKGGTSGQKVATKPDTREAIRRGAAKRKEAGLQARAPLDLGKQISHIAGKHNVLIEWTVTPLDPGDVAACACNCSWVCSCYAMPESHREVVLDPSVIGNKVLQQDNLDLGVLFKKRQR
jgi:hypothetical protein